MASAITMTGPASNISISLLYLGICFIG
uniref:Uncharacterized protein n=1 Tax=Anguilla anguilla TaxID=7936 RepID=A0A0E9T5S9_ANGAN